MSTTLVFTATYNESDSVTELVEKITSALPHADLLVVDDSSPDGTFEILQRLKSRFPQLRPLKRPRKLGVGSAHQVAMQYALRNGYDKLITMDADFSHHPDYLPSIDSQLGQNDFVIGSRYAPGGSCEYRGFRLWLSRFANSLVQRLLGVTLCESTTSYRGFTRELLTKIESGRRRPPGYAFFFDVVFRVSRTTERCVEVPIHFHDRRFGKSNLSKMEIVRAAFVFAKLIFNRVTGTGSAAPEVGSALTFEPCHSCGSEFSVQLYPARVGAVDIARFQRTTAAHRSHGEIRKCLGCGITYSHPQPDAATLQKFYQEVEDPLYVKNLPSFRATGRRNWRDIERFLPPQGSLLEVGCYCGAFLDVAAAAGQKVKGLEPSRWAVDYCKSNTPHDVSCGSISDIPSLAGQYDSVVGWNVMEHATDPLADLKSINRALKPGGKFVFSTLNIDNWFPKLAKERWPWFLDMHLFYYTPATISDLLSAAGFRVVVVRPYCNIVAANYLLRKLDALGLRGLNLIGAALPLDNLLVPFRFGDNMLVCATKISEIEPEESSEPARS